MWPAIIAGGAAVAGGLLAKSGADKAAAAQQAAVEAAIAEQRRQFDLSRSDLRPWQEAGAKGITELSQLMGINTMKVQSLDKIAEKLRKSGKFGSTQLVPQYQPDGSVIMVPSGQINEKALMREANRIHQNQLARRKRFGEDPNFGALTREFSMDDFLSDPVTQSSLRFGLDEGTKAISRMAKARGMYNSGATLKGLTRFTTDYIGQQAGAARDRFVQDKTNLYNRFAGISGSGQTAATNTANLGANTATNVGNLTVGGANARGAAAIAGANAVGSGLTNAGNILQRQYFADQMMNPSSGVDVSRPLMYDNF